MSVEDSKGPFAASVRKKLETTTDAKLLFHVAQGLMRRSSSVTGKLDFDPVAVGRAYLERAAQLAPDDASVQTLLVQDDHNRRHERISGLFVNSKVSFEEFLGTLPEAERFEVFADGSDWSQMMLFYRTAGAGTKVDVSSSTQARRQRNEEALALAEKFKTHKDYGTVVFNAHIALGVVELQEGNRRRAVEHLRAAGEAPASAALKYSQLPSHTRLVNDLLHAGERESVIAFYERLADINAFGRDRWLADAKAIREGRMTRSYQGMYGSGGK